MISSGRLYPLAPGGLYFMPEERLHPTSGEQLLSPRMRPMGDPYGGHTESVVVYRQVHYGAHVGIQ